MSLLQDKPSQLAFPPRSKANPLNRCLQTIATNKQAKKTKLMKIPSSFQIWAKFPFFLSYTALKDQNEHKMDIHKIFNIYRRSNSKKQMRHFSRINDFYAMKFKVFLIWNAEIFGITSFEMILHSKFSLWQLYIFHIKLV